ncbi:MAG: hypothetical protein II605_02300 [Paludibacteraceae bacterium]|nr:hypothetical protein [Paludibacteraceae bacterium]MBQ4018055.1 hypothetical protein [Paludibacteraceae bacterium]MBQ5378740.1 hypothetical protein [Paludibacteraceae bacterium]
MKNNIIDRFAERIKTASLKDKRLVTIVRYILVLSPLSLLLTPAQAQNNDTVLNRTVTVERDFQPVIQAAGKVSTKPAVVETTIEPAPVVYSDYTVTVETDPSVNPLLSQPTRFAPGERYNGYIRGAIGHPNTLFDFGYHLDDGKNSILDVYAHHKAEWGLAALSKTKVGLNFTHTFSTTDLYFGVSGGNIFYNKYGHFYDYSQTFGLWEKNEVAYPKPFTIGNQDKTSLWTTEVYIGVKANAKQDLQYRVQTGYMLFAKAGAVAEHQIRTSGSFDWHAEEHHVGANVYVQNNFLQLRGAVAAAIPDSLYGNRHNFRIEPYYAYEGSRLRIHVGVNLDMNIGQGHQIIASGDNFNFAPSPHINLEAQVANKWLTIYADIMGSYGLGSLQSYMEENRYSLIHAGIVHPCTAYTPVDAEVGFHIKPHRDLMLELHGGYAYMMYEDYWIATADTTSVFAPLNMKRMPGDYIHEHAHYQRGKVGGQINYHYRDIVRVNFNGDYYIWSGDTTVYDRPNWEMGLRIDGRIDEHWSLYSDNYFAGKRIALATDGEHTLAPTVELNLGVQYDMWVGKKAKSDLQKANGAILRPEPQPNLMLFFQLNNWLHRKNEIMYGYRSQGINFLLGATYKF